MKIIANKKAVLQGGLDKAGWVWGRGINKQASEVYCEAFPSSPPAPS